MYLHLVFISSKSWQVFKRKALALVEDLRKEFGEFEVEYNPSTPRRGSFEVVIIQEGKEGSDLFNILFIIYYCIFCFI